MAEQKASAFLAESMKNGTIVAGGGGRRQGKEGKCKGKERKGKERFVILMCIVI
jgi:hypothetical protein